MCHSIWPEHNAELYDFFGHFRPKHVNSPLNTELPIKCIAGAAVADRFSSPFAQITFLAPMNWKHFLMPYNPKKAHRVRHFASLQQTYRVADAKSIYHSFLSWDIILYHIGSHFIHKKMWLFLITVSPRILKNWGFQENATPNMQKMWHGYQDWQMNEHL